MCFRRTPLSCTTRFMWSLWPSSSRRRSPSAHCSATDTNPGASEDDSSASSKRYKHAHISGTDTVTNICVISKRAEIMSLDLIKVECLCESSCTCLSSVSVSGKSVCLQSCVSLSQTEITAGVFVCMLISRCLFGSIMFRFRVFCVSLLRSLVSSLVICENDTSYLQSSLCL